MLLPLDKANKDQNAPDNNDSIRMSPVLQLNEATFLWILNRMIHVS